MSTRVRWRHTPAHYSTTNLPLFWDQAHADAEVDATAGPLSDPALTGASADAFVIRLIPRGIVDGFTVGVGANVQIDTLPTNEKVVLAATDALGAMLVSLSVLPDGRLAAYRGDREALLSVSTDTVTTATPLRLGIVATIAPGGGTVDVQIDGASFMPPVGGVDTGSTPWGGVYLGMTGDIFISHAYALDEAVLLPALLLLPVFLDDTDLDDTDPDGDTTVVSLAVGTQFSRALKTFTAKRVVYGVSTQILAKASGAAAGLAPLSEFGGTAYVGDREPLIGAAYTAIDASYPVHPVTGLPFVSTDLSDTTTKFGAEAQA